MELFNQLLVLGQTWTGATLALFLIFLTVLFRRALPTEHRPRTIAPLFCLSLAFVAGLSATVALKFGAYTLWGVFSLLDLLGLIIGMTSLVGIVIFDLALTRTRFHVPSLIRNLIHVSVLLLIVLTILYQRGLDPLSLLTTSAVLTAVIGLALQNTIANLFAGLALQIDRTLGITDWIKVGEHVGRIAEIKWRSTLLWTEEGDLLVVPNSQLLDAAVLNLSRPDVVQREEIIVGFHYRHPPNTVKQVLLNAAMSAPRVLSSPAPDCIVADFSDSAITYKLRYWINDYTYHTVIASDVRTRVWYAVQRAGLEIPFPIRTLVVEPSKATVDVAADHRSALEQTGLFPTLSAADFSVLAAAMKTVRFAAGEEILREHDSSGALHIVRSGEVSVYVSVNSVRREVATLKPGEFFGEVSLLTGESQPAGYIAKSDAVCSLIDHDALASMLRNHPQLADGFSTMLVARETTLNNGRQALSDEAAAQQSTEAKKRLLSRIQQVFRLGSSSVPG
ncbi:MAG: cyclic nucleotide-binding domain-containing protein [Candidatus Binatia bacterium]